MKCPASLKMSKPYPNTTNPAAELGTAAHELGEFCLRYGAQPYDCKGMEFNNHVVDEAMIQAVATYVNHGNELRVRTGFTPLLEQRLTMSSLGRNDVFGTSDFTLITPDTLYVRDYKHGYGTVEAEDNSQLIGYGIAGLDTFNLWESVKYVDVGIIQPRARHIKGPIRSAVYTVKDMLLWQLRFAEAIRKADSGTEAPVAGPHCKWCPAKANCRAHMNYVLDLVYRNCPANEISVTELEVIYENIGIIESFLAAIAARSSEEVQKGYSFSNHKLVNSYGQRSRKPTDEKAFLTAVQEMKFNTEDLYEPKLKAVSKIEKIVGKDLVSQHFKSPEPKKILVPMNDNRPALQRGKVPQGTFQPIEGK